MRDNDFETKRYEDALAAEKAKRAEKKRQISSVLLNLVFFLFANLFAFLFYSFFLSKLVKEKLQAGDDVSGLVITFSILAQLAILIVASLRYRKNGEENRRLLAASRLEGFSPITYYIQTLKRFGWISPAVYFLFQTPFLIYHLILGYYYEAETTFAHFYIPQLCLMEKLGSIIGVLCNVLLYSVFYCTVIFFTQKSWLRNRIRA